MRDAWSGRKMTAEVRYKKDGKDTAGLGSNECGEIIGPKQ